MDTPALKSPFPGMDPYLEQKWPAVHARLIVYASNQLNSQLPDDLEATIEEDLAVRVDDEFVRSVRPDVHVVEASEPDTPSNAAGVAVAQALIVKLPPRPERHVAIVDGAGRVITAIEFLSPWNKLGHKGRERYTRKKLDYLAAGINLVEVDLVRQGSYVLAAPDEGIPEDARTPYLICVYRNQVPDEVAVYRAPLRERLPIIPVPLRSGEPDVVLQLQLLIDICYRDGRHYRTDYQRDPAPALSPNDAAWADKLLREQGRRK